MERTEIKPILEALLFVSSDPLSPAELRKLLRLPKNEETLLTEEITAEEESQILAESASEETLLDAPADAVLLDEPEVALEASEPDILGEILQKKAQLDDEISTSEIRSILVEMQAEYTASARGFELVEVAKGFQLRTPAHFAPYVRNLYKSPKPRLSPPALETLSMVAYQQPVTRSKIEQIRGVESGGVLKTLLDRDLVRIVGRSEEAGRPVLYGTTRKFLETFSLANLGDLPTLKDLESAQTPSGLSFGPTEEVYEAEEESDELVRALDESESSELIDELESSIHDLKQLEETIFQPAQGAADSSDKTN